MPEGVPVGERVSFEGFEGAPEAVLNPKKKLWEKIAVDLKTNAGDHFSGAPPLLLMLFVWYLPSNFVTQGADAKFLAQKTLDVAGRLLGLRLCAVPPVPHMVMVPVYALTWKVAMQRVWLSTRIPLS